MSLAQESSRPAERPASAGGHAPTATSGRTPNKVAFKDSTIQHEYTSRRHYEDSEPSSSEPSSRGCSDTSSNYHSPRSRNRSSYHSSTRRRNDRDHSRDRHDSPERRREHGRSRQQSTSISQGAHHVTTSSSTFNATRTPGLVDQTSGQLAGQSPPAHPHLIVHPQQGVVCAGSTHLHAQPYPHQHPQFQQQPLQPPQQHPQQQQPVQQQQPLAGPGPGVVLLPPAEHHLHRPLSPPPVGTPSKAYASPCSAQDPRPTLLLSPCANTYQAGCLAASPCACAGHPPAGTAPPPGTALSAQHPAPSPLPPQQLHPQGPVQQAPPLGPCAGGCCLPDSFQVLSIHGVGAGPAGQQVVTGGTTTLHMQPQQPYQYTSAAAPQVLPPQPVLPLALPVWPLSPPHQQQSPQHAGPQQQPQQPHLQGCGGPGMAMLYDETTQEVVLADGVMSRELGKQGHVLSPLPDAYRCKLAELQAAVNGQLLAKREALLQQHARLAARAGEVAARRAALERDVAVLAEDMTSRIRSAESLKQALLGREQAEVGSQLQAVQALLGDIVAASAAGPVAFLNAYRHLADTCGRLAARPFKTEVEVSAEDLPAEAAGYRDLAAAHEALRQLLGVKDQMIADLLRERQELQDELHHVVERYTVELSALEDQCLAYYQRLLDLGQGEVEEAEGGGEGAGREGRGPASDAGRGPGGGGRGRGGERAAARGGSVDWGDRVPEGARGGEEEDNGCGGRVPGHRWTRQSERQVLSPPPQPEVARPCSQGRTCSPSQQQQHQQQRQQVGGGREPAGSSGRNAARGSGASRQDAVRSSVGARNAWGGSVRSGRDMGGGARGGRDWEG